MTVFKNVKLQATELRAIHSLLFENPFIILENIRTLNIFPTYFDKAD